MSGSEKPLSITIPVKLPELKVAFSVAALAFEGGRSAGIDFPPWTHRSRHYRLGRECRNHCGLSHERRPRDIE